MSTVSRLQPALESSMILVVMMSTETRTTSSPPPVHEEPHQVDETPPVAHTHPRWWAAVIAGLVASIPMGWLLSYGAALMAMLGLFFFALFGLVIGAVIYRVANPVRPIPIGSLRFGCAVVVLFCWGFALFKEYRDFPHDKANEAIKKVSPLPEGVTSDAFKKYTANHVRKTLRNDYGVGVLGYANWAVTSSRIELPVETMRRPVILGPTGQRQWWWALRVVLSVVFLWYGVYSVVQPLRGLNDPPGASNPWD